MKLFKNKSLNNLAVIIGSIGILLLVAYLIYFLFFEKSLLFRKEERQFTEAVEGYYFHNPNRLPKEVGAVSKVTLKDMYDAKRLDVLRVPGNNTQCSSENSWVKVIKNGEDDYTYYTYLECGKFKSKVDSVSPEIVLEGDNPMYISLGSDYTDPGVKSAHDNVDGDLDISEVSIDTSGVNTKQIGEYTVRYTAYDSLRNKKEITRTVYVVRDLLDEVKANTNDRNIYQGSNVNNYVLYSGMLFRIVKANDSNLIQLVSDNSISVVSYGSNANNFEESDIAHWLNEYFYPKLQNKDAIVKNSVWCLDSIDSSGNPKECGSYSKEMAVGILSAAEYLNTYAKDNDSYLNSSMLFWLTDIANQTQGYANSTLDYKIALYDKSRLIGVRPSFYLDPTNLYITQGNGSYSNPYKLNDYQYGRDNDNLNSRYLGEYVSYSGQVFQIAGFDENGNTKLVGVSNLLNSTTNIPLVATYENSDPIKKFNPTEEGNIAYQLNNHILDYIDEKLIVEHQYEIPTYDKTKRYHEWEKEKVTAMIGIPASYELFSSQNSDEQFIRYNYWLSDSVNTENYYVMVNSANGLGFDVSLGEFRSNAFKATIYLTSTTKLSSGRGTVQNPYFVK